MVEGATVAGLWEAEMMARLRLVGNYKSQRAVDEPKVRMAAASGRNGIPVVGSG